MLIYMPAMRSMSTTKTIKMTIEIILSKLKTIADLIVQAGQLALQILDIVEAFVNKLFNDICTV